MKEVNNNVVRIIEQMSLDQKIGAMLTLGFAGTVVTNRVVEMIEKYHCGGFRLTPHGRSASANYVDPKTGKTVVHIQLDNGYKKGMPSPQCTAGEYKQLLNELQELARKRPLGIPLHFSTDQEGGESVNCGFSGVQLFPRSMGIKAAGDSEYAYEVAKAVGRQCRAVGFTNLHSPNVDVNTNGENPEICTRSYSDSADEVAEYAEQACRGFKEAGIIATAKHFPGRGDSAVDAHFQIPEIDVDAETMWERELKPYRNLIEKGLIPCIMLAHTIYPALDPDHVATVSKKIVTGLLREKMGFDGVITTDSMTMGGIATKYTVPVACAMALEAGADLVLMKSQGSLVEETIETIKQFIEEGRIPMEEVDRKVYRILSMKYEYGLFHARSEDYQAPEQVLQDPAIYQLSKDAALRSVLIARDRRNVLPLSSEEPALVIEQADTARFVNLSCYPGILYQNCCKYNKNLTYLETDYTYDEDDWNRIKEKVSNYSTIIITNYFTRGRKRNTERIQELLEMEEMKGKRVVLVTNTPYELTIPSSVDTVVITFAGTVRNCEVTAGTLFGKIQPQGKMPVKNGIKE